METFVKIYTFLLDYKNLDPLGVKSAVNETIYTQNFAKEINNEGYLFASCCQNVRRQKKSSGTSEYE